MTRTSAVRRTTAAVGVVAITLVVVLTATSAAASAADEIAEVDTSLEDDEVEGDGLTYRRALAEELGVTEDELRDAARRARQQVVAYRLQQAHDAGVTDPERLREVAEELGLTDPDLTERLIAETERAARGFSDRVAGEVSDRATEESAERTANWLLRAAQRVGDWVVQMAGALFS